MILYLDTSSLVKLYVEESGSNLVDRLVNSSRIIATSIVAYAEARAAFARRHREKSLSAIHYDHVKQELRQDWPNYCVVQAHQDVVLGAGDLAEKYALRGFDAIHLASAVALKSTASSVIFSAFDVRLQQAAGQEGLLDSA
ncbi:MAG: type II toxin-antitoxin system VapC family toxin [Desulfovermiculus sp.]